jgi:hypothetical protein
MLDFLGIGAQKCGTTWLYEHLRKHPDIAFPAGKEIHFWDQHYSRGVGWYRSLFEGLANEGQKCGEITPAYATISRDLIRECHKDFPDLRLIYVIRNPIERAWSSAKMALARAEMEIQEASDQWFMDHFLSRGSLLRGDYESCLRNWLRFYPRDRILVSIYDDLATKPEMFLRKCLQHICADEELYPWPDSLHRNVFASDPAPLPEGLRCSLREIYTPKIASLGLFLGIDLSSWI